MDYWDKKLLRKQASKKIELLSDLIDKNSG